MSGGAPKSPGLVAGVVTSELFNELMKLAVERSHVEFEEAHFVEFSTNLC